MSKRQIISDMKDIMPFTLSEKVEPYVLEAMDVYAKEVIEYCKKYQGQTKHLTSEFIIRQINQ